MAKRELEELEAIVADAGKGPLPRFCGIVRPIADMGNYTVKHWRDVHNVIAEAVEPLGFTPRLVSESDASGVILAEIVSNLYQDEIVIVDVSGRNPNVMFELGMRLAFEKPAIIIKDDETPFSFDISPVKHIPYPRTLRYNEILKFKSELANAVAATLDPSYDKKNYLQQFGPIKVTELGSQSIDLSSVVQDVQEIRRVMINLQNRSDLLLGEAYALESFSSKMYSEDDLLSVLDINIGKSSRERFIREVASLHSVLGAEETARGIRVHIQGVNPQDVSDTRNKIRNMARHYPSIGD